MKNIIITAGPTNERIDAVMKITNMSTGALGSILADKIIEKHEDEIDNLFYICTKLSYKPKSNSSKIKFIIIEMAEELLEQLKKLLTEYTIDSVIHTCAVGDYKGKYAVTAEMLVEEIMGMPKENITRETLMNIFENPQSLCNSNTKISSYENHLMVMLELTPKVISTIKQISPEVNLIGFKLLENVSEKKLYEVAQKLLIKNSANYIVANDLSKIKNGKHYAMIISKDGIIKKCETKLDIANCICNLIFD